MKAETPYNEIAKLLKKDASVEEKDMVRLWIEASDENRNLFKKILKSWRLQNALTLTVNKDDAWLKVKNELVWTDKSKDRRIIFRRALQISAVVIIALGIGFLLQPSGMFWGEKMLVCETQNEQKSILLADGTEVFLNRHSKLFYPDTFSGNQRNVELHGEAFFKVKRNAQKPFIITTEQTQTKVLGTSFNLRAYAREFSDKLSVTTGKVAFTALKKSNQVILEPNQVGVFYHKSKKMEKMIEVDPNYLSWKTKTFVFDNASLESVVTCLNNAYGIHIEIQNYVLSQEHLTTSFEDLELDDILTILSQTLDFKYHVVDEETIIIK